MSPAFLALPAVLPGPAVLVVALRPGAPVGGRAAGIPAFPVLVPVAPVVPVDVPLLALLALHVAQRRAAEAPLDASLRRPAGLPAVRRVGSPLMVVVVVVVSGPEAVVHVLTPVLLVQGQLARLGLVGVVVAVVLGVDHQRAVQVGLHISTWFPRVGHLRRGT